MSLPIIWSPSSKDEYAHLLAYLEKEYGLASALKFMDNTDNAIEQISNFPESGTPSLRESIRKKVISKQTTLFYQIFEGTIEILHFWDNRQDPDNQKDIFR